MNTEIYIVAGFLGAGKTTLIQKLLKEAFRGRRTALIENDFGEISIDAALLKSGGAEVTEINSGCVCCTLRGDFILALRALITRFSPEVILIEPSGVSKLSDVAEACLNPDISAVAHVAGKITVADVKRCRMYLDNFGEFFEDQISSADTVVLARTQIYPDKIGDARELIRSLNGRAAIVSEPWEQIDALNILRSEGDRGAAPDHEQTREHSGSRSQAHYGEHERLPGQAHEHGDSPHAHRRPSDHAGAHDHGHAHAHDYAGAHDHGHAHAHDHAHAHGHAADAVFDAVTITTERVFAPEDLRTRIAQMERNAKGAVIRAKGILRGKDGYWNLQYLPGDLRIESSPTEGSALCLIGQNLDGPALAELFGGSV